MARLRRLLERARAAAETHFPDVVDAGRKWAEEVSERTGSTWLQTLGSREAPGAPQPAAPSRRPDEAEILRRVRAKADHGLKPEDRLVVIYATDEDPGAVAEIRAALEGIETTVREMDLAKEPPQTATQLAKLTGKMVAPYVYINGRYWGAQYEMISLKESGDLPYVVANQLDCLSERAKKLGNIRDSYSDEISVENILERWRLGHILCVDDLDAWFERDRDGTEHFFYEGAPRPIDEMPHVAERITQGVSEGTMEAKWMLEPSVHLVE